MHSSHDVTETISTNGFSEVMTVRFAVEPSIRSRAMWAFMNLATPLGLRWREVDDSYVPEIGYGCTGNTHTIAFNEKSWQFSSKPPKGDDLAATFWWLARVEEVLAGGAGRDEHDRFTRKGSWFGAREVDDHTVVADAPVDEVVLRLGRALNLRAAPWPERARFAVALTHDIDVPVKWNRQGIRRHLSTIKSDVRNRNLKAALSKSAELATSPLASAFKGDPYMNMAQVADLESVRGASSTNFVIAGHNHPADGHGPTYDEVRRAICALTQAGGGEVGLHGSYESSVTPEMLSRERTRLERDAGPNNAIRTHRFHYLRHRPEMHWQLVADTGFTCDASLGYAEHPGLRAGFSWPYIAWDWERSQSLDLVLLQTCIMDATFEDRYLGCGPDGAWQWIEPLINHCERVGGGWSVLWHNDKLIHKGARVWNELYIRLLDELAARGAWMVDAGTMADHWHSRASFCAT